MLKDGATFIDIGAYSSRPNAEHISEDIEAKRLLPIIKLLIKNFPETLILLILLEVLSLKKVLKLAHV